MKLGRLIGLAMLIIGIIFLAFPNATPQHAKIYLQVDQASVSILESELETYLPLAMLDTYVRNLTMGDRTLDVQANLGQAVIGNYQLSSVGVGYTLIRTDPFKQVALPGTIVQITVTLRDNSGSLLSSVKSDIVVQQPLVPYALGVFAVIVGIAGLLMPQELGRRIEEATRVY